MKYAPIKAILLRNFRSLEEVVIKFDESPIVSIIGDNEAGKSSITKGLQTIGANLNPNSQKDYIRTDTDGFIVAVKFADDEDTMVIRLKSKTENGFRVQKGNQIVWSVNKLDSSNVPPEIQKYMGFVIEPETKELLNIRTYEDLMVFIHTSSSTNYKIIYNALKVDNILRAKKTGQIEVQQPRRAISDAEASVNTLTDELRRIKLVDLDPLLTIRKRIKESYDNISSLERASGMKAGLEGLDSQSKELASLASTSTRDEMQADTLSQAKDSYDRIRVLDKDLQVYDEIDKLDRIDTDVIDKLDSGMRLVAKLSDDKTSVYSEIENTSLIEVQEIVNLQKALSDKERLLKMDVEIQKLNSVSNSGIDTSDISVFEKALEMSQHIDNLNRAETETREIIKQLEEEMKQFGVYVTTCPNCGETVIFNPEQ